jgi:hypothetical protein
VFTGLDRREFLQSIGASGAVLGGLAPRAARSEEKQDKTAPAREHTLTVISGNPRERGRQYGQKFKQAIQAFRDNEILSAFEGKPNTREQMLRYAGRCGEAIKKHVPIIHDELEGMAEGSGLPLEDLVLITLHEELWHKAPLPHMEHCTAVAIGPPATRDGRTYVGQTWDWMQSVFGVSSMLLWKRTEGPSLLCYAYPGLWVGAGLNSAGLALCWTSATDKHKSPRVGVPAYVYLAHLLYQKTLDDVASEARRVPHAGWFTFVLADAQGRMLNIEGSPQELAIEPHRGSLARVLFGSRQMTRAADGGEKLQIHARCRLVEKMLKDASGRLDGEYLQKAFADPKAGICQGKGTIDMMVFNTTAREALVSRGSSYGTSWKKFTFES